MFERICTALWSTEGENPLDQAANNKNRMRQRTKGVPRGEKNKPIVKPRLMRWPGKKFPNYKQSRQFHIRIMPPLNQLEGCHYYHQSNVFTTGHNSYRRWTMVKKFRYQRRNNISITTQKWKLFINVDLHHRSKRRSNRECPTLLRVFSSKFLPKTCRR
jgi:hypothetical protein